MERDEANSFWRAGPGYADEWLKFDKMVIANGHYRFPRFLDVPGLEKWLAAGKAAHSAWYRRSGDSGSPFLIVGGNFSGRDIVTDITSLLPTSVVHLSVREPPLDPLRNDRVQYRGQAVEFLAIDGNDKGKIRYEGGTEDEIDSCVLATG